MNTGVYKITNVINGKFYVGSTASLRGIKRRWRDHINALKKNKHNNGYLQNSWNKYGETSFKFEIIEMCSPEKCISREQYHMDTLHPDYNIYLTAGSPLGRIVSEETKRKISATLTGNHLSEETKQKISISLKGKPKSKEHIHNAQTALVGKLQGINGGRFSGYYKFKNNDTGEEVVCPKFDLVNKYNLDSSVVSKICNGKRKSHHKWVCLGKEEGYV